MKSSTLNFVSQDKKINDILMLFNLSYNNVIYEKIRKV